MKDHLMRNQNGRIKPSKPYLTINHSKSKSKNVKPIICRYSDEKRETHLVICMFPLWKY